MKTPNPRRLALAFALAAGLLLGSAVASAAPISPGHGSLHSILLDRLEMIHGTRLSPLGTSFQDGENDGDSDSWNGAGGGLPYDDWESDSGEPNGAIPEPAGALLFAAGFAAVALRSRRS